MKEEDLSAIKRYSIVEYLERKGIKPARKTPTYAVYRSPLREEVHPSFKVDTEKNLWIDYAEGRGGSIIDLCMRLEDCTLSEAICRLGQNALEHTAYSSNSPKRETPISSNQREHVTASGTRRLISISDTLPPHLQEYLIKERCINLKKATPFLKCISYEVRERDMKPSALPILRVVMNFGTTIRSRERLPRRTSLRYLRTRHSPSVCSRALWTFSLFFQ